MAEQEGRAPWLFASLRGYRAAWLSGDLVAALTLAAIAVPEQIATAHLVGLPAVAGLIAFAAGSIAVAVFGANRFMSAGADSTIAPIMAGALAAMAAAGSPQYAGLAVALALACGITLVFAGLIRAGWIADLISTPVVVGFLAGISVHIIVGQLPQALGVPAPGGDLIERIAAILRALPQANPYPLAIAAGVVAVTMAAERISARIPGPLIGLALASLAVALFGSGARGLAMLGALPVEPARAAFFMPTLDQVTLVIPIALIVALVCMVQTAVVARSFPAEEGVQDNISRDFLAVGVGSILAALAGAFAVNASPPRTAAVRESGGRSQLAGLLAVAVVVLVLLLAARAFAFVPEAALSGVLIVIGLRIFRLSSMRLIRRRGGYEFWLMLASLALVVVLPIQVGVTMSILLSLMHSIYIIARPDTAVLSRVPGTTVWWKQQSGEPGEREPGVIVFAPGAPIHFTNAAYVRGKLMNAIAQAPEPCRLVVIEAHGVIDVDFTGSQLIQQTVGELRARGIEVALARLESERAQRAARDTGLIEALGAGRVFRSVEEAIRTVCGAWRS